MRRTMNDMAISISRESEIKALCPDFVFKEKISLK